MTVLSNVSSPKELTYNVCLQESVINFRLLSLRPDFDQLIGLHQMIFKILFLLHLSKKSLILHQVGSKEPLFLLSH